MAAVIPFERTPGLPPLFLAFARGEAAEFLPDPPSPQAAAARARQLGAAETGPVRVATGQQAGLFTGPLYALSKALAAARLAARISTPEEPARGLFWAATEDHDLAEIAQATLLLGDSPRTFRLDDAGRSYRPAGTVEIPEAVLAVFDAARREASAPVPERLVSLWAPGRTFGAAFVETMEWMLSGRPIDVVDPLERVSRDRRMAFFRRAVDLAPAIVEALEGVEGALRGRGFTPQVERPDGDFPFFLIEGGTRRKVSWRKGRFSVYGYEGELSADELFDFAEQKRAVPSTAALLRPVFTAYLYPVAAEILGPSELSYHAQCVPLYDLFGVTRPVFFPRPHLLPRGARERRAIEALGLAEEDLFRAPEAVRGEPPALSARLAGLRRSLEAGLEESRPDVERLDPTLVPPLEAARDKIAHQLDRLREKVEQAAERRDGVKLRRLEIVESHLAPGGAPADRVYGPLTYLSRFGEAFVPALAEKAECLADGLRFVDFE
jgi:bacillithiol biosynthesis cysteine-adding enzyme BshC